NPPQSRQQKLSGMLDDPWSISFQEIRVAAGIVPALPKTERGEESGGRGTSQTRFDAASSSGLPDRHPRALPLAVQEKPIITARERELRETIRSRMNMGVARARLYLTASLRSERSRGCTHSSQNHKQKPWPRPGLLLVAAP
ncbi:MAG: hypothetical protein ACREVG_09450, partial [Burkholderiales bacterium]